jgi:hypothetical protein
MRIASSLGATAPVLGASDHGWLPALEGLFPVPADFRNEDVDRTAALDMLRCGDATLDVLVQAGLPCRGEPGAEWFDRYDLFNLALASKSGTSVPERAIGYALRWMHADPRTWTEPVQWSFDIQLRCPLPECGPDAQWSHSRLDVESVEADLLDWHTEPATAELAADEIVFTGPGPVGMRGQLVTRGRLMTLQSPALRSITADFLAAGYSWVRLPERLQCDYERVMAAGVAPCITGSLFLQKQFQAAGYEAITRRGWLLGMLDLAHSWVEVVDDDGVRKSVDPIFARLADHAQNPHPMLVAGCIGSRLNRLLPTAIPADGQMVSHRCQHRDSIPVRRTVIRRATAS